MHLGAMLFAMAICATSLTELARFHWLVYLWEHRDSKVKPCTISSKHSLVFFLWWQCQLQWRKLKPCQVDCWLMNLMAHIASRLIKSKQCELSWTSWHLKVLRLRNVVHVKALLISCPAQAQMQEILALRFQKGLETWPWPWLWQRRFVLGVVAIPVVLHHPQSLLPIPLWVTSHWKRFLLSGMTYLPSVTEWEMGESLIMRFDSTVGKTEAASAVEATVENLKLNTPVLLPIMEIMAINDLRLPSIEALIGAIEDFYQLCKKTVRQPDYVYQEAWSIRRMIGRAKKFIYRPHPPQDWPSKKQVKVKVSKGHNLNPTQLYLYNYISYHNATSHPHVF